MKHLFTIFAFLFMISYAFTQECGTTDSSPEEMKNKRYYKNDNYLLDKLKETGYDMPEDYFENLDNQGKYKGRPLSPRLEREKAKRKRKKNKEDKDNGTHLEKSPVLNLFGGSTYYVPLKIWIIKKEDGTMPSSSTVSIIENKVDSAISIIRDTGAPFEMYKLCDIGIISSDRYFDLTTTWLPLIADNERNDLFDDANVSSAVNMYFVNTYRNEKGDYSGGNVPKLGGNELIMANTNEFTLAHELGHVFGLEHTHRGAFCIGSNSDCNNCKQESVDRNRYNGVGCYPSSNMKKCNANGDLLCDTPADPELSDGNVTANSCQVINNLGTDNWGDAWVPSTTNIMAYTKKSCRSFLSFGQIGVMLDCAQNSSDLSFVTTDPGGSIEGSDDLCVGNTYTFTAPGTWFNYMWELPPNVAVIGSSTQQNVTFTVTAHSTYPEIAVSQSCGSPRLTKSLTNNAYDLTIDGPPEMPDDGTFWQFSTIDYQTASSYFWTVPSGWGISSGQGTANVQLYANPGASPGYVRVSTQICSTQAWNQVYMNIGDGGGQVEVINVLDSTLFDEDDGSTTLIPNPVQATFAIKSSDSNEISCIEVVDIFSGKSLINSNKSQYIDVNELTAGIYLVRIIYADGKIDLKKMIKQ